MHVDANTISLTLRYLNMASIPGEEVDTFREVRAQWQNLLAKSLETPPVSDSTEANDD